MRSAVALALAVAVVASATTATAAGPVPVVDLTVTPDGLVDGQQVTVDGELEGIGGIVVQCRVADLDVVLTGDVTACSQLASSVVDLPLPITVEVRRWIPVATEGGLLTDCAVDDCVVFIAGATLVGSVPLVLNVGYAPLDFSPERGIHARDATAATRVAASYLAAPSGSVAFAMRCGGVDRRLVCGDVGTVDLDFDGTFSGEVARGATFEGGGTQVDCRVHPCGVAVVVLGPGPTIVDVIAVDDPSW